MIALAFAFIGVLYLSFFQPFMHDLLPVRAASTIAVQDAIGSQIHHIQAQISPTIHLKAETCLFSDNTMIFHNVHLTDCLKGSFYAQKITWIMGSPELHCEQLMEGILYEQKLTVSSSQRAIYHMSEGVLEWDADTQWNINA